LEGLLQTCLLPISALFPPEMLSRSSSTDAEPMGEVLTEVTTGVSMTVTAEGGGDGEE
jgi:hypothetical protein